MRVTRIVVMVLGAIACADSHPTGPLIGLDHAPTITNVVIQPTTVFPGDPFSVSFAVRAPGGVAYTTVTYEASPQATFTDSVDGRGAYTVTRTVSVPPIDPTAGVTAAPITVAATDQQGRTTRSAGDGIHFTSPAIISGQVDGPYTAVRGDTFALVIQAHSLTGQDLAWVGYYLGPLGAARDSVAVTGLDASHAFQFSIPVEWPSGWYIQPTFFTRDRAGHRGGLRVVLDGYLIEGPRRPFRVAPFGGAVTDVLLDTLRDVLYLAQPDSNRILRLSLGTMTFDTPIALTGRPTCLDLSLTGDSLLVGLYATQELGVVDLESDAVSRLPILGLPSNLGAIGPVYLREAANGKVLMGVRSVYGLAAVWAYDLTTGQQGRRFASYEYYARPIIPVGDRSRLALGGRVYASETDTLTPVEAGVTGQESTDRDGRYILTANYLWTADFNPVRTYLSWELYNNVGGAAISGDASYVFLSSAFGYYVIRASDGAILQHVPVNLTQPDGAMFSWLLPLPDGHTLIGVGLRGGVARIDLGPLPR